MPKIDTADGPVWQRRRTSKQRLIWFGWLIAVAIAAYAWQLISEKTIWFFVWDAPQQMVDISRRMVPPAWSYMDVLWKPIWDTLNIATIGSMISMAIAIPVAFAAAHNTTPHKLVRAIALFIIVATRSINSLVWALLLVVIVGPGVLAGTLAIGIRSIGGCAKLLYESIEEINQTQVEAIEATGASPAQKMIYGVLPQVLPTFAGVGVFRWDVNVRGSTILGIVGAGGIGVQLNGSINTLAWTQVSMILLVILVAVILSEWISAKVRHAII